jgi:uncharacterized protein
LSAPRKLPLLEPETAFFWTSGADGVLRIQRCTECGRYQHPPLILCQACHSDRVAPEPVSGRGRVATWSVNHQAWLPGMDEPFVFAAIELAEQTELYVLSNVLAPPDALCAGLAMEVCFEHRDDVWIPLFRPAEAADER